MSTTLRPGATVLAIGATGSIGRHVVDELRAAGLHVKALARDVDRARRQLPDGVEIVPGDLATGDGLAAAVDGADGIVLTHGGDPRAVDYGGVKNLLAVLAGRRPRIALMTSMSVTRGGDFYGGVLDWKRRSERLLRASGLPATIVRPGWFDMQGAGDRGVVLEQGDGSPIDGRRGVGRVQIARTLVQALLAETATGVTLELFAAPGEMPDDWAVAFGALERDDVAALAGAHDAGVAVADEPAEVLEDIAAIRASVR